VTSNDKNNGGNLGPAFGTEAPVGPSNRQPSADAERSMQAQHAMNRGEIVPT